MEQEKLDLTKSLKDCPRGTKLYSPIYGEVMLEGVYSGLIYPIDVIGMYGNIHSFTADGRYVIGYNGECMLFPSKDKRDWSKFVVLKPDLPEGTIVMCSDFLGLGDWCVRKYHRNGKVYNRWDKEGICDWKYIIPFDKFNPSNIEECIKKYNYGTGKVN